MTTSKITLFISLFYVYLSFIFDQTCQFKHTVVRFITISNIIMNKYVWGVGVLVLVALGAFVGLSQKAPTSKEAITIGAVLSLSGDAASDGLSIKRGLELAVEDLAEKGIEVRVVYQDDKTDPKQTISAIEYLVATEHPQALVGPTWSFLEDAAAATIAREKIIAYAPANTSEFVSIRSAYQFQGAPRNALSQKPVAQWLVQNGTKRAAIIVDRSAWGASVSKAFKAATQEAGVEVVVDETIAPFSGNAASEMANAVTKAKAAGVEVILWTGYDPDAVSLAQTRVRLGYTVPVIALSSTYKGLFSRGVLAPAQLVGIYYLSVPTAQEFVTKFEAKYGQAPGNYADRAYDGLMVLAEALQHAPAKDADTLAQYLRTDLAYTGYGGVYEFNEKGDVLGGDWVIRPVVE